MRLLLSTFIYTLAFVGLSVGSENAVIASDNVYRIKASVLQNPKYAITPIADINNNNKVDSNKVDNNKVDSNDTFNEVDDFDDFDNIQDDGIEYLSIKNSTTQAQTRFDTFENDSKLNDSTVNKSAEKISVNRTKVAVDNAVNTDYSASEVKANDYNNNYNEIDDYNDVDDYIDTYQDRGLDDVLSTDLTIKDVPLNSVSPETLKTFVQAIDLVRRDYVTPVSDDLLFNNAIYGMLKRLDTNAEFLDAAAYENLRAFTDGDVGHVGLEVVFSPAASQWVISKVAVDSPAQQARLRKGQYVHQINDTKLSSGMQVSDVVQLLSGIAGTQIDIVISEAGRTKHSVTLQRNIMQQQQLYVEVIDDLAYIKLPIFQNNTAIQIIDALEMLDVPITGVLIDLRNNPGGVLKSAIEVASLFMDNTDVVQVRGRQRPLQILTTQGTPILKDLPVVILQNRYSASASEVLASSLKINKRAIIVGERSYGKGSVQAVLPLNEQQAIKLTVAYYFGADGSRIDRYGVSSHIDFSEDPSLWKERALSILREQERPLGIVFTTPEGSVAIENDY